MATTLLYHRDPLLLSFDATVTAVEGGAVILDETAFYPEAGGQMADHGVLAGLPVTDVQVDDAGVVRHHVTGAAPAVGTRVAGTIEKARRRQFMALHTAQHMLSRALIDEAGAETVSARLGENICTVDIDVTGIADAKLAKAEALVNAVVDDDIPIRAFFPTDAELQALPLRRRPKVSENIRVVSIGDASAAFDVSPCGGTHCVTTAQVGLVRVVGLERYKGMMRVSFQAGPRARAEVFERARTLEGLAKELSSTPGEVPASIEKLRAQLKGARDDKAKITEALAGLTAEALAAGAVDGVIVEVIDGDVELMRAVGERTVKRAPGAAALLAVATQEGLQVLCIRGASSTVDCGAVLKRAAAATGGRGGGKPERAEGRLPAGTDWKSVATSS